ncbi:hypothetical protein [Microbacterium maritypicum]
MNAYAFPLRQSIKQNRDDGTWTLFTGTTFIPGHPTWQTAMEHAAFINRIRTEA